MYGILQNITGNAFIKDIYEYEHKKQCDMTKKGSMCDSILNEASNIKIIKLRLRRDK